MSLCTAVMALVAAAGLASHAAKPGVTTHRLRNVAAADAAQVLSAFRASHLGAAGVAEPVSNTVLVSGTSAQRKQAADLLAALDQEPATVLVRMTVVRIPAAFLDEVGLREGQTWVMTPREAKVLSAAIRGAEGRVYLARPEMMVLDNHTVFFQTSAEASELTARVTPRIEPDAGVRLGLDVRLAGPASGTQQGQRVQAVESMPAGGTVVMCGPKTEVAGEGATGLLILATVHTVRQLAGRP